MEVLILIGLIVLNGVFAMSEIALVTARRARLTRLADEGDHAAAAALKLGEEPTRFLSTVQIGITSIGILNGIFGEAVLAEPLALWLVSLGVPAHGASIGATVGVVIVITYVSIVIGELVPKRLGQLAPESIARLVARPMQLLAVATRPFVHLLSLSTEALLRLMGVRNQVASGVTEEEIQTMLDEGSESGTIDTHQHEMLRNVFRLDDRQLSSLMIPRADVVSLDTTLPFEENLARMSGSEFTRYPVCAGALDRLSGVVNAKHVLTAALSGGEPDWAALTQSALFVPETLTGMELLEQFRAGGTQMAFVVDEYGEIEGIVTLHDLLEAVTGEFTPRDAEDAWALQREDGSWLLDGSIPVPELKDKLALKETPEEDKGRYHTLSGMLMLLLGRVARTGDVLHWQGWRLEIVDMDELRIDKVLASRVPDAKEGGDESEPA
ncbi:hemolysin family protein [Crenobacter intestini]|uniref:HlyC/CorC family transporter n=1 Tax=Crenobacter intestini TaxID=2563443 RepID=A0A4T0V714_9NEIS|nr:hemolysin family protein [Crenobacter intestini]TIC87281.1 HlyC/CorC family transporter [Crenobacter intestini]